MAEEQDDSQKTEEPTQKRLEDARKKGDIVKSQDVASWFSLLGAAAVIAASAPIAQSLMRPMTSFLDHPHAFRLEDGGATAVFGATLESLALPLGGAMFVLAVLPLIGHILQSPPLWTGEKMKPKLQKVNPIEGLKRTFGPQGWMNLLKAVLKMVGVAAAVTIAVWPSRAALETMGGLAFGAILSIILEVMGRLLIAALIVVGIVSVIDYVFQRQDFMKRMRMSRQEIRDEMKQTEGDPLVKAKLRQIRQERARKRMLAAVPTATVVVTNPTHYSVALRYDRETTPAPIVVAKGVDAVALRIREVAKENDVPIIENPPLARALFAAADLDEPIPNEHFEAVAKVIGFVLRTAAARNRSG